MKQRVYHYIAYHITDGEAKELQVVVSRVGGDNRHIAVYEKNKGHIYQSSITNAETVEEVVKRATLNIFKGVYDVRKVARGIKPFPPEMYLELAFRGQK